MTKDRGRDTMSTMNKQKTPRLGRLLKPREVSVLLGVTPRTVVRWIREGKLGGHKIGRVWRIPSDDNKLHQLIHGKIERIRRKKDAA